MAYRRDIRLRGAVDVEVADLTSRPRWESAHAILNTGVLVGSGDIVDVPRIMLVPGNQS